MTNFLNLTFCHDSRRKCYGPPPRGGTRDFIAEMGDAAHRRSLYTYWKRTSPPPNMTAFDAPSRETCTVRRPRTNTPLQALVLLNDPTYVEAARAFGIRAMKEGGVSAIDRITWIMRQAVGRRPTPAEIAALSELYAAKRVRYDSSEPDARALAGVGDSEAPDGIDVKELAAWTAVTRVVLNLHETVTRN